MQSKIFRETLLFRVIDWNSDASHCWFEEVLSVECNFDARLGTWQLSKVSIARIWTVSHVKMAVYGRSLQSSSRLEFPEKFQIDVVLQFRHLVYRKFAWSCEGLSFPKKCVFQHSFFTLRNFFWTPECLVFEINACVHQWSICFYPFFSSYIQFHSCWTLIISFFLFEVGEFFMSIVIYNRFQLVAKSRWKCFDYSMLSLSTKLFMLHLMHEFESFSWLATIAVNRNVESS